MRGRVWFLRTAAARCCWTEKREERKDVEANVSSEMNLHSGAFSKNEEINKCEI